MPESAHGLMIAELKTSQTITLLEPAKYSIDLDEMITFKYKPASRLPINWCVLRLNESFNTTNTNIINNSENIFEKVYVPHGPYNWSVTCVDSDGNNVTSGKWDIWSNRTVLISQYLGIDIVSPETYHEVETGTVNFRYTPRAVFGLNRCELITNNSVRKVDESVTSEKAAEFGEIDFSEGVWRWQISCVDKSSNEYNSELRTLKVKPVAPEPIPDPPRAPISPEIKDDENVTEILEELKGKKTSWGLSNAMWATIAVVVLFIGIGAVVIITDKKFELELIKDVQLILYKLNMRKDPPEAKKKHAMTEDHKDALKDYIKAHMLEGVSRAKIESHLRAHKWKDHQIKEVFSELEKDWEEWRGKFVEKR
jgi:hypothetical protein